MKLEEAIAKAKILNDSLKELTDEYEGQGSFIAAGMAVSFKLVLDTILTALHPVSREQLERVWPGCSFCKNDGVQDYRTAVCVTRWGMSYLKGPGIESDDIFYAQNHFCRFCGRPLTLEAWKEMRKRWEAANDAD